MNHPPAHSFSHSPVEEVFCRCIFGSDTESRTLTIPPPYPGWPNIRDRIRDMIVGAGDVSRITGCMLKYTDLIPVVNGKNLPGTEAIERLLSVKCDGTFDRNQNEIVLFSPNILDTTMSVRSLHDVSRKPGWTLIFTMKTERPAGFVSGDNVVKWFDEAHAGIHDLFDLIVPDEIMQILR